MSNRSGSMGSSDGSLNRRAIKSNIALSKKQRQLQNINGKLFVSNITLFFMI